MPELQTFADASHELARFYDNAQTRYTLDNMQALMQFLGEPQNKLQVVHVAGTSGKTSTAYYCAALLTAAGYKTGLTVSPHVDQINERVQINMQPLSEAVFCRALSEFLALIERAPVKPSWFELMVALAYWYFARESVDYAVVEVGLGGLLDGTNVITRADKTCIITDIGLDHTAILGKTLAAIAEQKAGIIQPGNQVFLYEQDPAVMTAVLATADSGHVHVVPPDVSARVDLPLFQQRNFHLAEAAMTNILGRELTGAELQQAAETYIPGRLEVIEYQGKTVVLDGAHNAQKLQALLDSLHVKYPAQPAAALVAFADGDPARLRGALETLGQLTKEIIVTSFTTAEDYLKTAVDPQTVAERAKSVGLHAMAEPDQRKAWAALVARPEQLLVVTGSFYLLGHIRALMLEV
jgi:dihydrofolate synthase/folylpolyglutamate synthase